MNQRDLGKVPLEWIRAFEAAGRSGSFTAAARDLGVTQAAVSQRIAHLEAWLGAPLFLRQSRRVVLTVEGEAWLPFVSEAMTALQQSVDDLFSARRGGIAVSASASVTELWIADRLRHFPPGGMPDFSFHTMIVTSGQVAPGPPSVRIRYGAGSWPDRFQAPMYLEALSPVAAPSLLAGGGDWRSLPRIGLTGPRAGWKDWCSAAHEPAGPAPVLRFDSYAAALAATVNGLGVVLASLPLTQRALSAGQVERVSDFILSPRETYWVLAGTDTVSNRKWDLLTDLLCDIDKPLSPQEG